jgi:hypothetical protein
VVVNMVTVPGAGASMVISSALVEGSITTVFNTAILPNLPDQV